MAPGSDGLAFHPLDRPPEVESVRWPSILGGKGAGLARMVALGLPVPPGFTLPVASGRRYLTDGWWDGLGGAIDGGLDWLEEETGRRLGDGERPLLVSVRSGAPVSMPGMLATVLNVGLSAGARRALGRWGGEAFGRDTHRRFLAGYGEVVGGAPADDPRRQVQGVVQAVFDSWRSPRAVAYRRREGIPDDLGTAVTVQTMVFGNLTDRSGTGVVFSRDPSTGAPGLTGDVLVGGQGEDVVSGTHRTWPISSMAERWPHVAAELAAAVAALERELSDLVDVEFTVEDGRLWLLQGRVGMRSPRAALRLAIDLADDPDVPLDRAGAVARVAHLLDDPPTVAAIGTETGADQVVATGLAASPGRAVGVVSIDPDDVGARVAAGHQVILVRPETSPADVHGMAEAAGLVTTTGGPMSHAAVIARSWRVPAVVGATSLVIADGAVVGNGIRVEVGHTVTVDGDGGRLLIGAHPAPSVVVPEVEVLRTWQRDLGAKA